MRHAERERIFLEIFGENRARLQRLCLGYLGSAADAEDLFQEVMVNVWNSLPAFRGEAHINTWLYRIAVNTALIYRRKRRPTESLEDLPEIADGGRGTHQNLENAQRLAQLRRAIATLPDQERLIVTLLLEGLSYKEIAEITGITVNYVGVKISRIKEILEETMLEVSHGAF